jgi:Flp pilus assembly protein TadD
VEVGDFYFQQKNYKAAEMRFRDALTNKPDDPTATFKLGQSLEKLGRGEDAAQAYDAYLKAQPSGPFAQHAHEGLARLAKNTAH